jgi:Tol biopolymer transport system component
MKTKFFTLIGAVLFLLATIASSNAGSNGPLLFNSYGVGVISQIFTSNDDGTNLKQLTMGTITSGAPSWHSNMQYISFIRDTNLFIMEARPEGGSIKPLLVGPCNRTGGAAGFSPDGKKIVYPGPFFVPGGFYYALMTRTVDLVKKKVSSPTAVWYGIGGSPSFSPDGDHVLFYNAGTSIEPPHIKILDLRTSGITSFDDMVAMFPTYSPDGNSISFVAPLADNSGHAIYIRSVDGTHLTQVASVPSPGFVGWLSFSQDGTQLVFSSNPDGEVPKTDNMSIYKANLTDGTVTLLLRQANAPHWRP